MKCDVDENHNKFPDNRTDHHIETLNNLYSDIAQEGTDTLVAEGIDPKRIEITYDIDMRYIGQYSEVTVPFEIGKGEKISRELFNSIVVAFHERHDTLYGYSLPNASVEIVNLRVSCKGITDKPKMRKRDYRSKDASSALKNKRQAFFSGVGDRLFLVRKFQFQLAVHIARAGPPY